MVSANRVAAINPPIDDTDPIRKFSIDPGCHTDWQNPADFSPKGKPIRNFSIDPTSSIRTRLRTPFLWTPFPRLLLRIWGFRGPAFRSARQVLCGDASRLLRNHFSKHVKQFRADRALSRGQESRAPKHPNHLQRKPPFGIVCL